tara:strand:- start:170 stop:454 length:285 start_codon:yes stop_codon:yes gene_type:complete
MILNTISPKNLILFGIFETLGEDAYTIDKDNLMVTATVNIAFNVTSIEEKIASMNQKIDNLEEMEDVSDEVKENMKDNYIEVLEILTIMREKLK